MIVVSDTSPLNYLILVQAVEVLPAIFDRVYIPERVVAELNHPAIPAQVAEWISAPPAWLIIRSPLKTESELRLDPGETHAISLALELHADWLLIDEWAGRNAAKSRGLPVAQHSAFSIKPPSAVWST